MFSHLDTILACDGQTDVIIMMKQVHKHI